MGQNGRKGRLWWRPRCARWRRRVEAGNTEVGTFGMGRDRVFVRSDWEVQPDRDRMEVIAAG